MTCSGVIFDLDGTLLDTEAQAIEAGRRAFEHIGLTVPNGFFEQLAGVDFHTGMAQISNRWPDVDTAALDNLWSKEAHALQSSGIPLKPGVMTLLDKIDALNLPKAIATSSFAHSAKRKLAASHLADRFETVISVDCVTHAKPHAEPFLLAAERLGVSADTCLAFEDSETGSKSAFAAGMTVVVVPDVARPSGKFAHHMAQDILQGAQLAGLI